MPELPEVETIASGLWPMLAEQTIEQVTILNDSSVEGRREMLEKYVAGRKITHVHRRGKLLLMDLSIPERYANQLPVPRSEYPLQLAFHLKMSGRLFVYPADTEPARHTRIIFDLSNGTRLFFDDMRKFGFCRALAPCDYLNWQFWQQLGPEPLTIETDDFVALFRSRRTRIKAALLDQKVIAGIGNIYADESLFRAGIRPDTPSNEISKKSLAVLHIKLKEVLKQAIRECGSSIRDYRDAHGDAGAFQNNFLVYGRSGQDCRVCGEPLTTEKVAGRTTVYCKTCQK
ncbi:bifunctional DNA-formamidopyrimidine glycosylase/DNA-(apurinic or apyrimidinic site) lyase [Halodesulfovibrio sp.]|jgi:formamidopyrimidine-DNA glycosylase|uniref:bifunctional DNA-formamidopyrimidine glycosylase/DNA-(apurinic or apyrimidinic site) lyase n=1 Tax=Halodesulfovibrio sp. TaxID=1912772 RepID=UPI0025ED844E|nr:bifunctional DNA-formamidopyrimidine glycosylase/DNA-(apurinic or apyrimidinic site) lyase [Halodesulfovibrio sp.]MCT4535306.1 bifunctional DNA-formamidopyrimidine glycosylase/DNA-(apurinic or apyrimidinic site) lyase [Halodesulfovibrio sp.]